MMGLDILGGVNTKQRPKDGKIWCIFGPPTSVSFSQSFRWGRERKRQIPNSGVGSNCITMTARVLGIILDVNPQ